MKLSKSQLTNITNEYWAQTQQGRHSASCMSGMVCAAGHSEAFRGPSCF